MVDLLLHVKYYDYTYDQRQGSEERKYELLRYVPIYFLQSKHLRVWS